MSNSTLLLISSPPHSRKAALAVAYARKLLADHQTVRVFFYGDGAYHASRLLWQTADVPSVCDAWVEISQNFGIALPVCVSTALARGITDSENAARHTLDGDNLRAPFALVGLSELAMMIDDATKVEQF